MNPKQFVLVLRNRVGALARITAELAYEGVNIIGISARDLPEYTVVRMVVHDHVKTERILRELGEDFETSPAIIVPIPNEPGALHRIAAIFAEKGLGILYLFIVILDLTRPGVLFRLDDHQKGIQVLMEKNVEFYVV